MIDRAELEDTLGGVQLRAMNRAIGLAAGVRPGATPDGIAFATRPGKKGLPLVGVHGFGGDKETWLLFATLIPRSRGLALIDLPGHGRSVDVPHAQTSVRYHAEAVLRVMDQLGLERAIACGNSMGGGVALRLARSWPDRIAGLVLVASVGTGIHGPSARALVDTHNPLIPRLEDVDRFMEIVLQKPPPVGRAVIRHVITQRARRADVLHRLFRGLVLGDGEQGVPEDLGKIRQRALIIHGESDKIIDKRSAEELVAALPHAELVIMRGIGHAPQLEAPRTTARMVERFAERIDAQ